VIYRLILNLEYPSLIATGREAALAEGAWGLPLSNRPPVMIFGVNRAVSKNFF